jgi:DNA polymerase-3 subunit alpha
MREIWRDLPEACDNTLLIAERLRRPVQRERRQVHAALPLPGRRERGLLAGQGGRARPGRPLPRRVPDEVRKQAEFEIGVITSMGFAGYFLVVADFINWAKDNGIRVGPGRGSGAGSMVAYAMRITDLDPLVHGLIFERFLNPDRVSMPDFDIDFDERRRGEVIKYVTEKYGDDRVSMIVTYGTIKAKQAVKDSSRILGYPFAMGDRITKAMPAAVMGKDIPLKEIFNPEHRRFGEGGEFRGLYESDATSRRSSTPRWDRGPQAPVGRARRGRDHVERAAHRRDPAAQAAGRRRDDHAVRLPDLREPRPHQDGLPGLRNLTVLDDALDNIEANRGETVVLEELDARRPSDVQPAPARRHARRLPARRRPDARAAALDAARQLRGHLRGRRALPARPDGRDSHNKYARRKTGREPVEPIHPELAEPLRRSSARPTA